MKLLLFPWIRFTFQFVFHHSIDKNQKLQITASALFLKSFFNFSYTYMRVRWTFFIQVDLTFAIVYRHLLQSFKACCAFRLVRLNIKAKIHITNIIIENDFLRRAAQNKSYIQKIIIIIFTFINSCCFSISFWRW